MCRKKKIKCDGKMPKCSHCINYKTECVFTHVEKKRNPPKGYVMLSVLMKTALTGQSAKYIEGLENRLGRMESLLRLSGLLSEDDGGKTDLGTLEKRLADRSTSGPSSSRSSNRFNVPNTSQQTSMSHHSTPRMESHSSPRTAPTSPESQKESEAEVEGLSDMMCSLVTNNSGETRYIGIILPVVGSTYADIYRVIVWILHLLPERYPMGQREDGRHVVPGYDIHSRCRRQ